MLGKNIKPENFNSRKEYLVKLAIEYINSHTGYMGVDDGIFYDNAECDGCALAEDLKLEFNIDE